MPANFPATNPEAVREALETRGESLTRGLANLLATCTSGRISQTDESAFEVGRNLATTPGAVVFENELMQVIQYAPTTAQVRATAADRATVHQQVLHPRSAAGEFVRPLPVEAGTPYSWCHGATATPALGQLAWDDYVEQGVIEALTVAGIASDSSMDWDSAWAERCSRGARCDGAEQR